METYKKFLVTAYNSGVKEGFATGLGLGSSMLVVFLSYALAIWYGGKLILDKGYTGGTVLNVILAILTGSMWVSIENIYKQRIDNIMFN